MFFVSGRRAFFAALALSCSALAGTVPSPAHAQSASTSPATAGSGAQTVGPLNFKEITSGAAFPTTITARDLSAEWRRLDAEGGSGGPADPYAYLRGLGQVMSQFGLGVYYTRGETVTLGSETYLVAYRPQIDAREMQQAMRFGFDPGMEEPEPFRLARNMPLALSLLNLRTVGSLTNIRPFDPARDLERELTPAEANPASTENLRRLGEAVLNTARTHGQRLPEMTDVATVRRRFFPYVVRRASLLVHPRTKEPYRPNPRLSNRRTVEIKTPATVVLFYEATPGSDNKRGVVFLNGQATRVPDAEWTQVKAKSDAAPFVVTPPRTVAAAETARRLAAARRDVARAVARERAIAREVRR